MEFLLIVVFIGTVLSGLPLVSSREGKINYSQMVFLTVSALVLPGFLWLITYILQSTFGNISEDKIILISIISVIFFIIMFIINLKIRE